MKIVIEHTLLPSGSKVPVIKLYRGDQMCRLNPVTDHACDQLVNALTGLTCNITDITDYRQEVE